MAKEPLIKKAYEEYLLCRLTQLVVFRVPKGTRGGEKTVVVVWPQGLNILPSSGGLQYQDYITTRLFNAFLNGERAGCAKQMSG